MFRPAASSGPVIYFDNDDMKKLPAAQSLEQVLVGRYSNIHWGKNSIGQDILKIRQVAVTFDIDGMFYEIAPPIEFSDVVSYRVDVGIQIGELCSNHRSCCVSVQVALPDQNF